MHAFAFAFAFGVRLYVCMCMSSYPTESPTLTREAVGEVVTTTVRPLLVNWQELPPLPPTRLREAASKMPNVHASKRGRGGAGEKNLA